MQEKLFYQTVFDLNTTSVDCKDVYLTKWKPRRATAERAKNELLQELLQSLKQQTLMVPPSIPELQRIQNNMDNLLYCTHKGEDEKAKQYMQLQNRFLTCKHQLKSLIPEAPMSIQPQEPNQISTSVLTDSAPTVPNPVQEPPEIMTAATPVHS